MQPLSALDHTTHAGGVVYRLRNAAPELLLVTARTDPSAWVLPKGHIEPGESAEQAAVREVFEESGVTARIVEWLATVRQVVRSGEQQQIAYYLMATLAEEMPAETRHTCWLPVDAAIRRATYAESRGVLEKAGERLSGRT